MVKVAAYKLTGKHPAKPYRANTARALYWASLVAQATPGPITRTVLYKQWANHPPKLPKSGKTENPAGWASYFVRQGLLAATTMQVPAS